MSHGTIDGVTGQHCVCMCVFIIWSLRFYEYSVISFVSVSFGILVEFVCHCTGSGKCAVSHRSIHHLVIKKNIIIYKKSTC